jgi:iron complex outermembrane recepter protein
MLRSTTPRRLRTALPRCASITMRCPRLFTLLGASSAITASVLLACPAFAQNEPAPGASVGLEEVVVTARYRQESVQVTPLAITAVTGDALESQNITNVQDISAIVPNAFIRPGSSSSGPTPSIAIRGVSQTDFNFAFESSVGVYIDDVYHATLMGSAFDLMDIDRVEVLRGPQGTLFGKNSMGGAIRIFSKPPKGDDTGYVDVSYGEFNRLDVKGSFDTALVEDKLFLRVSGVSKKVDGYGDVLDFTCQMVANGTPQLAGTFPSAFPGPASTLGSQGCKIGSLGGENLSAARGLLRFVASDALELNFAVDYTRDQQETSPDVLLQTNEPKPPTNDFFWFPANQVIASYGIQYDDRFVPPNRFSTYATFRDPVTGRGAANQSNLDSYGVSGKLDYDFADNLHLKFIAAYRAYNSDFSHDGDASPVALTVDVGDIHHEQSTAELQLTGALLDKKLDWTAGAFYFDATTDLNGWVQYVSLDFLQQDVIDDTNKSIFLHGVYHLTDRLGFTAGVRYSDTEKVFHFDHAGAFDPAAGTPFPAVSSTAAETRFDWKVGADYKFTEDVLGYAQVSTGFRPGGVNPRPVTASQLLPFDGEEMTSYELGVKSEWFDRRLRVNLAGFYSDYSSRLSGETLFECFSDPFPHTPQASCAGPATTWFVYVNSAAEVHGAELEIQARPIDGLALDASAGWNKFKSKVTDPTAGNYSNPDNLIQPELNLSAGIQYTVPFASGSTLTPRLDWVYQSEMTYNPILAQPPPPLFTVGGYGLLNGRITLDTNDRRWTVALSGTNLTNKFYYYNLFTATGMNYSGQPGRPREWAISLRRNFN